MNVGVNNHYIDDLCWPYVASVDTFCRWFVAYEHLIFWRLFFFFDDGKAGGLDTLTLNSLYDEGAYRASLQPVYGAPAPNPFEVQDPFAINNAIAAPTSVQMASIAQQQAVNPFAPYQPQPQPIFPQQQHPTVAPSNPFGDAGFSAFPQNPVAHHPQSGNPFGSTGLL